MAAERVEAVGEPIQVEATGDQLPRGHGQKGGEEHGKSPDDQPVDDNEDDTDQEPDRGEPHDDASGWRANGAALSTDRYDGQVAGGLQGASHAATLARSA